MRSIMKQRQIDRLYHFTQAENLENIFRYGIVPRTILDQQGIQSSYNDDYRYDNCEDAVCTSIELPNYKMFYKLRQDAPEMDWAVLRLDANILCDFNCAFCWTNAGDATMYSEPIEKRMGKKAFLELFGNKPEYPQRESLNIKDWYPTNPQAEVLVFGIIPIKYIQNVYFEKNDELQEYQKFIPKEISASVMTKVFAPREDWKAWQS
ncbi:MAG: DarT ssDNA thymidine ADP-ribosyltransferase family protein [Lachnospiraceae bacterium]|nr:DarT ssDNA thymidine ADP-ribosyltransferase family protein [Lachnospiraceae bacterium]